MTNRSETEQDNRTIMRKLVVVAVLMFGFGLSQLLFVIVVIKSIKGGPKAADNPWEAADGGLEWTVPSPAPFHTFETPPVVK